MLLSNPLLPLKKSLAPPREYSGYEYELYHVRKQQNASNRRPVGLRPAGRFLSIFADCHFRPMAVSFRSATGWWPLPLPACPSRDKASRCSCSHSQCTHERARFVPRKLYLFLWSYGCLLCSILVPYDHYTSLSSFVTDELTGFYIFCIFPEVNLFHSSNHLPLDISILPNSFFPFLT